MLDIMKNQSVNNVNIVGVLNELEIEEKVTNDGRGYVTGKASVRVDQEINGKKTENIIPVRMFSMKKKKDGTENSIYKNIVQCREKYTSLAAAEEPSQASRIKISGATIQENMWLDKNSGTVHKDFQLNTNFIRDARDTDEDGATFELSGVIGSMRDEMDKEGNETGRLKINFIVIGWQGKADVIELTVENPNAVNFIKNNWEQEDTVSLTGVINMSYKVETWFEEQGFGDPIKRTKTVSKRELIVTGGSPSGLDEAFSYDINDIKAALEKRKVREQEVEKGGKAPASKKATTNDFGF